MRLRHLIILTASCFLASCAVKSPLTGKSIMPVSAQEMIPGGWSATHAGGEAVPDWIKSFNDPELTTIVADAVTRNPDLRAAAARVEASRIAVRVAAASLYPRLGLKLLGERQGRDLSGDLGAGIDPPDLGGVGVDSSGGSPGVRSQESSVERSVYGIGIGASWEVDVWGRVRSRRAASQADSDGLEADYAYARQSLAAAVARAYFTAIEAAQQEANALETLSLYEDYSKLTEDRRGQGFASDFDVAQIQARSSGARDTYIAAQAARAEAIRAIEVVTSNYPAGKLGLRRSLPSAPRAVPAGLPAEILERRPDLLAAERRFAAAFHRENEARTARLPRLAISATGGAGTADLSGIGVIDALTWTVAGAVLQPIFFGGELKAAQDIRTSEQKAAVAEYVSSALRAFQEVENALAADYYLRQREIALGQMTEASVQSVNLGRDQFDLGLVDMFTILRLVGENLSAKVALTQVQASRLRERANLHLALGGNFDTSVPIAP